MNIAVIGTLNKDLIFPFKGSPIESFGGIYYTISTLSRLLKPTDRILPVSFVGEDLYPALCAVLEKFDNVSLDGLIEIPHKHHKVILEYVTPQERKERALFNFAPLEWEHVRAFVEADFVIVNFITGWDLSLNAYTRLQKKKKDALYVDIHFLVMGIDEMGRRFPQCPADIDRWLEGSKFIQMNQREFWVIAGEETDAAQFYKERLSPEQILLITLGERGVQAIFSQRELTRKEIIPGYKISSMVDTTGCGDVFGAAFVVKFLETQDVLQSARFANLVAAANATLPGTNEMSRLFEAMQEIEELNR